MKIQAYMNKVTHAVILTPYYEAMVSVCRIDISKDEWTPLYELRPDEKHIIADKDK